MFNETVIKGGDISDLDHVVERDIMIDHLTDKTSEEVTLDEATEVNIEEGSTHSITEINQNHHQYPEMLMEETLDQGQYHQKWWQE